MELFRRQATDAKRDLWLGNVDLTMSTISWPLALLVGAFVAATVGFFTLGTYSRSERGHGQLRPSEGLLAVVSPRAGTLMRTLVKEGDAVAAEQPLFEVSAERNSLSMDSDGLGATLKEELRNQERLLEDDLIWVNSSELSLDARVEEEIEYRRRRHSLLDEQVALKQQEAASAKKMLERVRSLDRGMLTALQLQQYESAALNGQGEVKRLMQQRMEAKREFDTALRQKGAAPVDIIQRRNSIERALADVAQSLAKNETETAQMVRAPRNGVVSIMPAHPGQAVTEGTRVLTLIPHGSVLQAELWVPSQAVGLLSAGGRVAMRLHAFPYRQFGHQYGRVISISDSALMPEEVRAISGVEIDAPSFRVLVSLDQQHVAHAGNRLVLRPSMTLEADFLLERQPLYRLLLPSMSASTVKAARVTSAGARP